MAAAARVGAESGHELRPIDDLGPSATTGGDLRSKIIKTGRRPAKVSHAGREVIHPGRVRLGDIKGGQFGPRGIQAATAHDVTFVSPVSGSDRPPTSDAAPGA
jgi:hypothetical protein